MDFQPLSAPGLVLDAWSPDDAAAVTELCQDQEIARWTRVPSPYALADAVAYLSHVPEGWAEGTSCNWAIRRAAAGPPIGSIGLINIDRAAGTAEVGYWIGAAARGQGVATAALRAVLAWALDPSGLGLTTVEWHCVVGNDASRRVAEACGVTVTKTVPNDPACGAAWHHSEMWVGEFTRPD